MNNSKENDKIIFTQPEIYDWSKHEKIDADIILNSSPERIKQLLRLNFTPRPYQIRMVRAGLRRENSLVCLQTGAGKTFVCIELVLFFLIQSMFCFGNLGRWNCCKILLYSFITKIESNTKI